MSFNLLPGNNLNSLPETKHKEKKSRYTMSTLQVRWPIRGSRSTNGSPTSKKSKGSPKKHKKSKSVDSLKSKSTDTLIISTSIDSELTTDNDRLAVLEAGAQLLSPHSASSSGFRETKKKGSPRFLGVHASESVVLPEEKTLRTPTTDRKTKALNSIYSDQRFANMPPAGGSCPVAANQRRISYQNLTKDSEISPPPMHPGRNRRYQKVSDIDMPHNGVGQATSGNVSPISGPAFQKKAIPASSRDSSPVVPWAIVSPLSIDMPQPQRAFVPPCFDKIIQTDTDPLLAQSRRSGDSATSSEFGRSASALNSPASSRSSIYSDASLAKPAETTVAVTEAGSRNSKAYSLISPVAAGVFDDVDADLKRNPTFKHNFSLKPIRNEPLPLESAIKIPPLSIRRTSGQEPMGAAAHCGRLIHPTSPPKFLPLNPRPSDLDILDEAFRRSGLHHVSPTRSNKSITGRASRSSNTSSSSPSLRKATLELEEQLSVLSGSIQNSTSWLKIGRNRCTASEFPVDRPPKTLKPGSTWRRSGSYSSISPTKSPSTKKSNVHSSFTFSKKKSWNGKDKIKVRPTRGESVLPVEENDTSLSPPRPLSLKTGVNDNTTKNGTTVSGKNNSELEVVKHTEKISCTSMVNKGQAESAERNLRLRLPRLRTQLSAKSIRAPANLSAVMESPTDRTSQTNNDDSPKERIMAALDRLDPRQPKNPHSYYSNNDKDNGTPARIRSLVFELDGSHKSSVCEPAGSKDMLCQSIPSKVAKSIIYRIMQNIDNLEDLFNLAVINKAFYSVFGEHSLALIKDTLFRMSPAAWELREICPPWETEDDEAGNIDMPVPEYTPNLYIHHYTRDLYTMVALKSLILVRCESFLRPDTARALAGLDEARCAEVDEAFWRVWSFCKLFGCGKGREDDITAQVDWLNGGQLAEAENRGTNIVMQYPVGIHSVLFNAPPAFSKGNHGGLSSTELYDMMEIWTCLGVLLQVFHGECKEARKFGIFDGFDVASGDMDTEESLAESWTQYLLTLGPSAILALTSINPNAPIESLFSRAQANGWTKWKSPDLNHGGPPRLFLKEAVSQVYESRLASIKTPISSRTPKSNSPSPHSPSPIARHHLCHSRDVSSSSSCSLSPEATNTNRRRQAGFAAELRRKRKESQGSDLSGGIDVNPVATDSREERPISHFSTVIENLDRGNGQGHSKAFPLPTVSTTFPPPIDTNVPAPRRSNSSIQNTPIASGSSIGKSLPSRVPISTPSLPTVTLESPTPPSGAAAHAASTSTSPLLPASTSIQHQRTFSTPETASEEKISRGRYPIHTSEVLDPVDMAMHKMVTELGFNEAAAKWALKCTDTGESLDVEAAINLLLQGDGQVDPLAMSASATSDAGNTNSSSALRGGIGSSRNEGVSVNGMCRSKTVATSNEMEEEVWRPVWRWA
ncbi:hypothetical protein ACJ72_00666 [Emergomyces africanus]|uniref:UBA domain-containing protein n=1 Tax=Emergomyces africanus TaxID=1955775 RepID=A0A1B7P7F5_9EURO|nr:hypothetical protein ACJ72_00666 [Emergomyces africanus]